MKKIKTPSSLKAPGRKFWLKVMDEFVLESEHDLSRLLMAAKCLDDLEVAEKRISTDGRFILNRYGNLTEHPGCKFIRDTRLLFIKIIRELGLDLEAAPPSKPPQRY